MEIRKNVLRYGRWHSLNELARSEWPVLSLLESVGPLTLLLLVRLAPSPNRSLPPIAVRPPIPALHCKTLNIFIKVCYSLPCLLALNPEPCSRATRSFPLPH